MFIKVLHLFYKWLFKISEQKLLKANILPCKTCLGIPCVLVGVPTNSFISGAHTKNRSDTETLIEKFERFEKANQDWREHIKKEPKYKL